MRVLHSDDRGEAGAFAPVERPRLVKRLAASASYPITLLIAPAGYGKSVVLRQYLRGLSEPWLRFAPRGEHATLLSFLRGFAEALGENAPHAITALAGAYERTTASTKRGNDLAAWMHAHLESFNGVIAIDDLHVADDDPEVAAFLSSLIERTKGKIRWILASRSTTSLPLGTWLAYHDADVAIAEEDLRFTILEARAAATALALTIRDDELNDLLVLTEGWPAALSFALRSSIRSSDLRSVSALTREMMYRFLAEQVYTGLKDDERALLEIAIALPAIDVTVLERAGFDRALTIVEGLRERTAFIHEESPGVYHCHELFREFLRHQGALGGNVAQRAVHERAARALEASGDIEHAIAAYVSAGAPTDVVRLLERHGFDMLERARGDVVARAIDSLAETTRRENATILALQGTLAAIAGKFARAESLLRRSLARAGKDRDLFATTSLRLASLLANQGSDVTTVLDPVANDDGQSPAYRAEALSLITARQAVAGHTDSVRPTLARIEALLPEIESDATRAKVLHHLGVIRRNLEETDRAIAMLMRSSELAADLHLYSVASRANAVLSNLALHEADDVEAQLGYAELAAAAATKAGDAFALQTALLQILSAHMRCGNVEQSVEIEERLGTLRTGGLARLYLMQFKAVRSAWSSLFAEAHRLMEPCWAQMHFDFDRVSCGAQYALFLALDGQGERSASVLREVFRLVPLLRTSGLFGKRSVVISKLFCAIAEKANGRVSQAERIVRSLTGADPFTKQVVWVARGILSDASYGAEEAPSVGERIESLTKLSYVDSARLLRASYARLQEMASPAGEMFLTASERDILRLLASGMPPKHIAAETGRSVNTVRVHIAHAIEKLQCHGSSEAIRMAQRLNLL